LRLFVLLLAGLCGLVVFHLAGLLAGLLGRVAETALAVEATGDVPLLDDAHDRLDQVVDDQTGQQEHLEHRECHGKVLHHLGLTGRHGGAGGAAGDHPLLHEEKTAEQHDQERIGESVDETGLDHVKWGPGEVQTEGPHL